MEQRTLLQAIQWRYATKRMTGEKVSERDVEQVLEAIRMAPTSRGLQPFKVIIIDSAGLKQQIQPIADNQMQITECSHLLVFAAETGTTSEKIDSYIAHVASERGLPVERLDGMKKVILRDQLPMNSDRYYYWASAQAYIALAYGQLTAATLGIDAAAMEGFNPHALDDLLGLKDQNLRSCVLLALGYRDETNDWMLKLRKVRKSRDAMFQKYQLSL